MDKAPPEQPEDFKSLYEQVNDESFCPKCERKVTIDTRIRAEGRIVESYCMVCGGYLDLK